MSTELDQRAAVIAEARTWLHTPWRHMANIKGQAVDCAMFLAEVFINAGVIERFDPRPYPRAWFMHHSKERFLEWVVERLGGTEVPVADARPGDLMMYHIGLCYSHGAILVEPRMVIHSYYKNGKVIYTETFDPDLATHRPRAFDMWARGRAA